MADCGWQRRHELSDFAIHHAYARRYDRQRVIGRFEFNQRALPNRPRVDIRFQMQRIRIARQLRTEPSLAAALAGFGYTAERLRQGGALREQALAFYQQQKSAYGDLQTANDAYAAAQAQAQETYMRYVKVARVALEEERGALHKLSVAGQRKRPPGRAAGAGTAILRQRAVRFDHPQ